MPFRYAAFISYAHRYQPWVKALQGHLETCLEAAGARPHQVFLDDTDLATGRSWVGQLQAGLASAEHLILVATPEALASPRVEDEYEGFISQRREWARGAFHVLSLVDTPLPAFVDRLQRLELSEHDDERYRQALRQLVGALLGGDRRHLPELPAALQAPPPPADVLPAALRARLVDWLAPKLERRVLCPAVAHALGVPTATLDGYASAPAAASAAVVAATGDDRRVEAARRIVGALGELFAEEDAAELAELQRLADELARLEGGEDGLLGAWLGRVARDHSNLVPFFEHANLELLDRVYVALELQPGPARPDRQELAGEPGARRLHQLLALDPAEHPWVTRRFVVRGDPGAGKTTLLRHLAAELAREPGRPFTPLFESLPRLMRETGFLLDRLEQQMLRADSAARGLAAALEGEARAGRLLLLLDGLDEVPRERREEAEATLRDLSSRWPRAPIVVTSRPIGYRRPGSEFVELDLLAFDEGQRQRFLARWFARHTGKPAPRRVARAMAALRADAGLWDLSGNPLYLTLMALLFEEEKEPDRNRAALYDQVFDLLLDGRHRPAGRPIEAKKAVAAVLRQLAFEMTLDNRDAEPREELEARLLREEHDVLTRPLRRVPAWEHSLGTFLRDLAEGTGILGPHDGPSADWRYWHRTFREALTAERLAAEPRAAVLERARAVAGDEGRWAEPFALLAGRVDDPDDLVMSLVDANRALGLRSVATAQRLRDETVRKVLALTDDPEERAEVFRELPELIDDGERALALVDRLRAATRDGDDLYHLEAVVAAVVERWPDVEPLATPLEERFFAHIPAPPAGLFERVETRDGTVALWSTVPAGTGWVGAADGEEDHAHERPRHRVELKRPLAMAAVPVTNAQYAAFDPGHAWRKYPGVSPDDLAQHPVVGVSWYAATAFCRWLSTFLPGARLPTEEEWELACRAGTATRYWSGESEEDLARVGWYRGNSNRRTHRVGRKPANPWQLYDLHGNVWEWTASELDPRAYAGREGGYEIDPARPATSAASGGGGRVFRGGSAWNIAGGARSAARDGDDPGNRREDLGFRVVLPCPRAGVGS